MSVAAQACLRCGGRQESGFLGDRADMQVLHEAVWASGEPRRKLLQTTALAKGERLLTVRCLRCTRCGLLESYATE